MKIIKSGICGTCIWELDNELTLVIKPQDKKSGVLQSDDDEYWPWWPYCHIRKAVVKKGVRTGAHAGMMFAGMKDCTGIDVSALDVSAAVDMRHMFAGCRSLTDISGMEKWDVSEVNDMSCMFEDCVSLKDISGLKEWDVSGVVDMRHMFGGCASLTDFSPLLEWNVSNMRKTVGMFHCTDAGRDVVDTFIPMACPKEGSFIGYKKCRDGRIVQLEVPEDAKRSSAYRRKCRCSKAKVLNIWTWKGEEAEYAVSFFDTGFIYHKGETIEAEHFDDDRFKECSIGIHFFMTRKEAEAYKL